MDNPLVNRRTAMAAGSALLLAAPVLSQTPEKKLVIEGYTDQLSYRPGDQVQFHLSSEVPEFGIEIARLGAKREVVWKKDTVAGKKYPVPANASSHGCNWPVAASVKIPHDWTSGYYQVKLTGANATGETFFVVRPRFPGRDTRILLQLSTNTYNAYTNWGGYSLYAYHGKDKVQGRRVSFDRPQYSQFSRWELPFVAWAESNGYKLDYAVNSDLEFRPEILENYRLMLSVGHDEYWSSPMRDHTERFITEGGNVAFFSGNTCCWQVRIEENGRALTCWKQNFGDDPVYRSGNHRLLSTLWSHHLVNRPENKLTGVGFLWGGYHRSHGEFMDGPGSYTVHRPEHWLFADTKVKRGEAFGAKLPAYKVVGYECDGCELLWKEGLPYPTGKDCTPDDFTVVATAPARWAPDDCEWYEKWEKGRTGQAVIGTYSRGGTVVTVGSTDWSFGLRGNDPVVTRVTKNVLDKLSK